MIEKCNSEVLSGTFPASDSCHQLEERPRPLILIAEDNPDNYKLYECILKREYDLKHAWNGLEAIELYRKTTPDLVIMDIKMPEMNGYEAFEELKKIGTPVPVIAVTAYAYAADEIRIKEAGFDDYISKPIHAPLLRKAIVTLLQEND